MPLFDQLVDRVSAALWNLRPSRAVRLGKHEYDGQVPDLSAGALAAGYERLGRLRAQVAGLSGLAPDQELDRAVLLAALDGEVFAGDVARRWSRCPGDYPAVLDLGPYLGRDYAPAGLRLERAAAVLGAAPVVLAAARANLDPALSRPVVEDAVERARARAAWLAAGPAVVAGEARAREQQEWRAAAAGAAVELQAFADWLEAERLPIAGDGFALGEDSVEQMLRAVELVSRPAGEVASLAQALLTADEEDLASGGAELGEGEPPPAWRWGEGLAAAVERARRFVEAMVPGALPAAVPLRVAELPPHEEEARLDPPGPYDAPDGGAVLYVPAEAAGPGALDEMAVTAGYPGGLLQSARLASAPSETARRLPARGFAEGWALYAGEVMREAGYGGAGAPWQRAWLERARRADARLVGGLLLHLGEMSLEQAELFFVEHGGCAAVSARREARAAAIDPGRLSAALGRLEILDLRRRWEARYPGASPGAFHDALLSRGAPPLGLLASVVLP